MKIRKKKFAAVMMVVALMITMYGSAGNVTAAAKEGGQSQVMQSKDLELSPAAEQAPKATVYMTTDISPEGLMKVYEALNWTPTGKVAVKLSTGEPPASNYLRPELIKDLVQHVDGTIVENNTAYGGSRAETAMHYQVAADHGFTAIADFQILDEDGSMTLPVEGGTRLQENLVGSHFADYDSYLVLSHFKGHAMAGFGGAIKNISIGLGSREGKCLIHTAGRSHTSPWGGDQNAFLESMGEAGKSVSDNLGHGERIVYINVMNNLSIDCDCDGNPARPDMHDIGILASTDPVAVDQACIDLVYDQRNGDGASLVNRIEGRNGLLTLEHAQSIGLGSREYDLVDVDDTEECDHEYTSEVTTEATCTEDGVRTYTCSKCGDSYTEEIPAMGHNYTSEVTTEATCTEAGVRTYTCSRCRNQYTEAIPAIGHDYTSEVTTEATCTQAGVRTYTCSKCGDSYTEEILAMGHDYTSEVTTEATCTTAGEITYTCSRCQNQYTEAIPATGEHEYTSEVTRAATCAAVGVRTYTCSKCLNSYTEEIPMTAHTIVADQAVMPGCTTEGKTEERHCSVCNEVLQRQEIIPATGHRFQTIVTAATATNNGSIVTRCTVCNAVGSETPVYAANTIKLSKNTFTYNGKTRRPSVTVSDSQGTVLNENTDYTVVYPNGMKNVGEYTVEIQFKNNYTGTAHQTFTINPKSTSITRVTPKNGGLTIAWKKQKKQANGYEVAYSTNSKFAKAKTTVLKVKGANKAKRATPKLKAGKKYFVRIRTYKTAGGKTYYSGWSSKKSVRLKIS